jgi:hypothetical protein
MYKDRGVLAPEQNTKFLKRCIEQFHRVNFAEQASGRVYLRVESGTPVSKDPAALQRAAMNPDTLAGIRTAAPDAASSRVPDAGRVEYLRASDSGATLPMLGQWGGLI